MTDFKVQFSASKLKQIQKTKSNVKKMTSHILPNSHIGSNLRIPRRTPKFLEWSSQVPKMYAEVVIF